MSHRSKKTRSLPAVMGSVIHNLQHNLPDRGYVRIVLRILVGNLLVNRVFGQQSAPLPPTLEQCRPVISKYRQMHVLLWNHITHRRISFDSAKPCPISGIDVHQGSENTVIGAGKVSHQFLRTQSTGSVNQSAAGPRGVIKMVSEYVNCHSHNAHQCTPWKPGSTFASYIPNLPLPLCFLLDSRCGQVMLSGQLPLAFKAIPCALG